jgi:hypothetical protein
MILNIVLTLLLIILVGIAIVSGIRKYKREVAFDKAIDRIQRSIPRRPPPSAIKSLTSIFPVDVTKLKGTVDIDPDFKQIGILTRESDEYILKLMRRRVHSDLEMFEYTAVDRENISVPLKDQHSLLEDGDKIPSILGKTGEWTAHIYPEKRFVLLPS